MLHEARVEAVFHHMGSFGEGVVDVASHDASSGEHVVRAMVMNLVGARGESIIDVFDRRQLTPAHRKAARIEIFNRACLADDHRYCFSAKASFALREDGLIGELRNHAVAVLTGNIFRGEYGGDSRVACDKFLQIAQLEFCAMIRTTNGANG